MNPHHSIGCQHNLVNNGKTGQILVFLLTPDGMPVVIHCMSYKTRLHNLDVKQKIFHLSYVHQFLKGKGRLLVVQNMPDGEKRETEVCTYDAYTSNDQGEEIRIEGDATFGKLSFGDFRLTKYVTENDADDVSKADAEYEFVAASNVPCVTHTVTTNIEVHNEEPWRTFSCQSLKFGERRDMRQRSHHSHHSELTKRKP